MRQPVEVEGRLAVRLVGVDEVADDVEQVLPVRGELRRYAAPRVDVQREVRGWRSDALGYPLLDAAAREALAPHLGEAAPDGWLPISMAPPETLDATLRLIAYILIGHPDWSDAEIEILVAAGIFVLAWTLQSLAGFGFGLVAMAISMSRAAAVSATPAVEEVTVRPEGEPQIAPRDLNVLTLDYVDMTVEGKAQEDRYFYDAVRTVFRAHGMQ